MKPNFALNLSHEGISLLHRAKAGWLRVGDVALDESDLNEQLKVLRRTAANLESSGLATKVVIPNSQILYTEIEAPGPDTPARIAQIRDGLVGLTPYDVSDLVFDWQLVGTKAQVAVVARETLTEAEAFAAEFRFNPVSFVAVPVNGGFDGEPFFGPTAHAASLLSAGDEIERDREAMTLLAPERNIPVTEPEKVATAVPEPVLEPVAAPNAEPAKPLEPAKPKSRIKPKPQPEPDPVAAAPEDPDLAVPVTFTSRRRAMPPPLAKAVAAIPAAAPEPVFTTRFGLGARDTLDELDAEDPDERHINGHDTTPLAVTAAQTADMPDASELRRQARDRAKAAGTAIAGTLGRIGQGTAAGMRRMRDRQTAVEASSNEADALTVFGARGRSQVRGKPRFLGLILTVLLLLALAVLALWSTYFLNDATSGWFGDIEEVPQVASVDPALPVTDSQPLPAIQSPEIEAPAPEAGDSGVAATGEDAGNAAIEAAVEAALLQVPAPETQPETAPEPGSELADTIEPEAVADGEVELALLETPEVALPDTGPGPDRISQPPPTRAQAEASYAATGIWQMDPDPLGSPTGGDQLEDVYVASIDPNIISQDAIALPGASGLLDDLRPNALSPPPSLGTRFDLDGRGWVRATPEGALSPEGVTVFSGQPAVVPPVRPGSDAALPEDETLAPEPELDAEQLRLASIRPTLRPEDLQETTERSRLGGFSRDELALIRPTIRPPSIQEERAAETESETATETAPEDESRAGNLDSATELAVAASRLPATRPGNFSSTVQKALEEAANNPPPKPESEVIARVAPANVPSIPTRTSVAKQATERNAINLGKVNLIGVYGSPSDRRALVRLKSGRYIKVEVGDRVDGGRVAAIGDDELRYVKGGRNITLKLPKG